MALTLEEVRQVALLARLRLEDEELARMAVQLGRVLDYVHQLSEVDTTNCEPMSHAAGLENPMSPDQVMGSLDREAALGNAPKRDDDCFLVPAVLT
jgi:aspartyl-tRNA(Asn)/glutamyl-tRNA(Gln) amidotransferase subunit C